MGTTSLTPRWKKCVNYVDKTLGYATGCLFVNTYFQEDKKHMPHAVLAKVGCPEFILNDTYLDEDSKQVCKAVI
ncbi:hypothetical protein NQZ68_013847 [Dissostichus eleginoides]|nr:hypothetical protein NQZ68_013847 [Dissostichus eleginoides]